MDSAHRTGMGLGVTGELYPMTVGEVATGHVPRLLSALLQHTHVNHSFALGVKQGEHFSRGVAWGGDGTGWDGVRVSVREM